MAKPRNLAPRGPPMLNASSPLFQTRAREKILKSSLISHQISTEDTLIIQQYRRRPRNRRRARKNMDPLHFATFSRTSWTYKTSIYRVIADSFAPITQSQSALEPQVEEVHRRISGYFAGCRRGRPGYITWSMANNGSPRPYTTGKGSLV